MAPGVFCMGWCSPIAPRRQQQRGYSGQTSERSRDVVVVLEFLEVHGDEQLGLRWPRVFWSRRRRSRLC